MTQNFVFREQLDQSPIGANPAVSIYRPRQTTKNPELFKGEKTGLLNRQSKYEDWKMGLHICWKSDPAVFDTEQKKLLYMVSLLERTVR
ncbi:hypothetical protein OCU04_005739 [Sclerotinia nivalis]|nr:hypothetical protein OCU04_005739 [Sclerotinia nivalis]